MNSGMVLVKNFRFYDPIKVYIKYHIDEQPFQSGTVSINPKEKQTYLISCVVEENGNTVAAGEVDTKMKESSM